MELTYTQKENIGFQFVLSQMQPCSPFGQQLLRDMAPMGPQQREEIQRQLTNIRRVLEAAEYSRDLQQLQRLFMGLKMVRPAAEKCLETELNSIELFELKRFLLQSQDIFALFARLQGVLALEGIHLKDTVAALDILDPDGSRAVSFYISDSSSEKLAALRREKRELEAALRENPDEALRNRRSQIAGEEELEEQRLQGLMSQALRPHIPAMLGNMAAIADLDLTLEKARIAQKFGGSQPVLTERELEMTDMVNPRILQLLEGQGKTFTPVSIALGLGATVITGANMGGKSVALKTIALNVFLVHCGFFPFAKAVKMPLFDGLHIISEDLESIDRGLSSFGGEMARFNRVTEALSRGFHFVLLDEFARGTNPHEGSAIARAVTRYLNRQNAISILATHYDRVADAAVAHYQVAGLKDLNWEALAKEIQGLSGENSAQRIVRCMNYGLFRVEGRQDCPRDALHICRLLGMPAEIVAEAEKTVSGGVEID